MLKFDWSCSRNSSGDVVDGEDLVHGAENGSAEQGDFREWWWRRSLNEIVAAVDAGCGVDGECQGLVGVFVIRGIIEVEFWKGVFVGWGIGFGSWLHFVRWVEMVVGW